VAVMALDDDDDIGPWLRFPRQETGKIQCQ
jgi:hypothetical protein